MLARDATDVPPLFAQLASNPVRWRLLRELVRSDRAVSELTVLVGEPQSLVSYHLRQLRNGGLVTARRSSADRRDSYYVADLVACRHALQAAGGALHPALDVAEWQPSEPPGSRSGRRRRVLFLCTGNSARSQIAEALIGQMSAGAIDARSAGSDPKPVHPNAVRVLWTRGIDISANRTKHLREFTSERFDEVITLCDRVREVCPTFPARPDLVHWSLANPALEGETSRASYPAFVRTADELTTRISFQLHLLTSARTRRSAHAQR